MPVLKFLAIGLTAGLLMFLASPGFAANSNDGVSSGSAATPSDPAAKQRRHRKHKHKHHRHHRRKKRGGHPNQAPAPQQG
jgi:hypothetical protein